MSITGCTTASVFAHLLIIWHLVFVQSPVFIVGNLHNNQIGWSLGILAETYVVTGRVEKICDLVVWTGSLSLYFIDHFFYTRSQPYAVQHKELLYLDCLFESQAKTIAPSHCCAQWCFHNSRALVTRAQPLCAACCRCFLCWTRPSAPYLQHIASLWKVQTWMRELSIESSCKQLSRCVFSLCESMPSLALVSQMHWQISRSSNREGNFHWRISGIYPRCRI